MSKVKKPLYKRWWVWVLVVIVIIVLANNNKGDESTPSPTASAPAEQAKVAKLTEDATIAKLTYNAASAKKATVIGDNEFLQKKTENQYVIVNIKVTNNGDKAQTVDSSMFKLKDASGKTFTAMADADMYVNKDLSFFLQQINPGTSKTGNIVFETSKDVTGLKLDVTGGIFSSKAATIDLAL